MKLIPIVLTLLILGAPVSAQDSSGVKDNIAFGAASWDDVDGMKFTGGVGIPVVSLLGFNVIEYAQAIVGDYGEVEIESAVSRKLSSKLIGGIILGPMFAMENGEDRTSATYLPFVGGVLAAYEVTPTFGVHGFAKYRFTVTDTETFADGWKAGVGLFARFAWPGL